MIKTYLFKYGYNKASANFEVNTEIFTESVAQLLLDYFTWDYDKDENPIDAVLKKYALEVIREASFNNRCTCSVISSFNGKEGFCRLDGSIGIRLIGVENFDFYEEDLEMVVTKQE